PHSVAMGGHCARNKHPVDDKYDHGEGLGHIAPEVQLHRLTRSRFAGQPASKNAVNSGKLLVDTEAQFVLVSGMPDAKTILSQDLRWRKLQADPTCSKCGSTKTPADFPR